ncbi:MAG: rane-fusion protein [Verrucomicrobiales bacterium]|nr:rane-fusion protein [Verrucomicrobiales bacterium]
MSDRPIFRKAALDRLTSPEQLDDIMRVTPPSAWMALVAVSVLILAAIVWSIFGRLPTTVHGDGILIRGGRIFKVSAVGSGQLTELSAKVGDQVLKGQVVGHVLQPQLVDQIQSIRTQIEELQKQYKDQSEFESKDALQEIELLALKQTNLEEMIKAYNEQIAWLKEKISNQQKLVEQGLITKQTLVGTEQSFYTTQQQIDKARGDLKEMHNRQFQLKNQKAQTLLNSQLKINETQRHLGELQNQLEVSSKVVSAYSGRVLETLAKAGDLITSGNPLLTLELSDSELEAVIYVSAGEGKKVQAGMPVEVIPATFEKAEYGYMIGTVKVVSDFPATHQAMMNVLENDSLVQKLAKAGPPTTLYATLVRTTNTISGFRWSSSEGPPNAIAAGTICTANVIVLEQRPISLVIPALKTFFGT